jgi:hypothetical protein
MKALSLAALLFLALSSNSFAQLGSSVVFDPSVFSRQLDQVVNDTNLVNEQLSKWQMELAEFQGIASSFGIDTNGMDAVMAPLGRFNQTAWQVQAWHSQLSSLHTLMTGMAACQGTTCASQATAGIGALSTYSQVQTQANEEVMRANTTLATVGLLADQMQNNPPPSPVQLP